MLRFRYTKPFHRMDASAFLRDFFSSSAAREHFRVVDRAGTWRPIAEAAGADAGAKCVAVDHALVPCDAVSMSLFDPILDDAAANPPIVRPGTDSLARRVDDVIDGFQVADELRDWLLNPDNENARDRGILPANHPDRAQFVFRVFEHLVLGGAMCQFEDRVTPYLDVAKRLYKALVRAKPDPNDPKRVKTASDVYAVEGVAFSGAAAAAGAGAGEETTRAAGKGKGGSSPSRARTGKTSVTSPSTRDEGTSRCGTTGSGRTGEAAGGGREGARRGPVARVPRFYSAGVDCV